MSISYCKRPGCENNRQFGQGYCCHECYWVTEGKAKQEAKAEERVAELRRKDAERESMSRRDRLADAIFPTIHSESERENLLNDLIEVIRDEMENA